jgi:hypothetical protein
MKLGNTSAHQSAWRILALIVFAFAWPVNANAQWTVIQLHPAGATASGASGVGGGQQVGSVLAGYGVPYAGLMRKSGVLSNRPLDRRRR